VLRFEGLVNVQHNDRARALADLVVKAEIWVPHISAAQCRWLTASLNLVKRTRLVMAVHGAHHKVVFGFGKGLEGLYKLCVGGLLVTTEWSSQGVLVRRHKST
jgi:hypothetical protein